MPKNIGGMLERRLLSMNQGGFRPGLQRGADVLLELWPENSSEFRYFSKN
jgi:hypothetical protein